MYIYIYTNHVHASDQCIPPELPHAHPELLFALFFFRWWRDRIELDLMVVSSLDLILPLWQDLLTPSSKWSYKNMQTGVGFMEEKDPLDKLDKGGMRERTKKNQEWSIFSHFMAGRLIILGSWPQEGVMSSIGFLVWKWNWLISSNGKISRGWRTSNDEIQKEQLGGAEPAIDPLIPTIPDLR